MGLKWKNVHISDEEIANDNAHIYVEKEMQRATLLAIETLDKKDIICIFPPLLAKAKTRLVLKTPKTDSSVRKVWLPKTLAYILRECRKSQEAMRYTLGDEYKDLNLVMALPDGSPCEERLIAKAFQQLRVKCELPYVAFHSLRHTCATIFGLYLT